MLMPNWMIPADKLDADQYHFMFNELPKPGNKWINGFAGSGKSILLIHALNDVLKKNPHARVLLTYYTHSLEQMYKIGMHELNVYGSHVEFKTYLNYQKKPERFDYIFCDEVQDLTAEALQLMRSNCTQLFVAGDPNQSIYDSYGIVQADKIGEITNSQEFTLTTVHRLTKSIVKLISSLLPSMGILKAKNNPMKKDTTVRLAEFSNLQEEVKYVVEKSNEAIEIGNSVAILLPSHKDIRQFIDLYCERYNMDKWIKVENRWGKPDYNAMNDYFQYFPLHYIGNSYGDLVMASQKRKVILMTYHSAKGLDFDDVYLPFVNESTEIQSDILFMVALSRSKDTLSITYSGKGHEYLQRIEKDCHRVTKKKGAIGESVTTEPLFSTDLDNFDF